MLFGRIYSRQYVRSKWLGTEAGKALPDRGLQKRVRLSLLEAEGGDKTSTGGTSAWMFLKLAPPPADTPTLLRTPVARCLGGLREESQPRGIRLSASSRREYTSRSNDSLSSRVPPRGTHVFEASSRADGPPSRSRGFKYPKATQTILPYRA
ncbi:hypothetical protein KM043_016231 [Ampulex compressa]|nr:hypothetical protein KM043_016231 [Ampulex compressa]